MARAQNKRAAPRRRRTLARAGSPDSCDRPAGKVRMRRQSAGQCRRNRHRSCSARACRCRDRRKRACTESHQGNRRVSCRTGRWQRKSSSQPKVQRRRARSAPVRANPWQTPPETRIIVPQRELLGNEAGARIATQKEEPPGNSRWLDFRQEAARLRSRTSIVPRSRARCARICRGRFPQGCWPMPPVGGVPPARGAT